MNPSDRPIEEIIQSLQERAKELECLYQIEEILLDSASPLHDVFHRIARVIPNGWQFPQNCRARITYRGESFSEPDFEPTFWGQTAPIRVQGEPVGQVEVFYTVQGPPGDEGPFLKDEPRLINSVA